MSLPHTDFRALATDRDAYRECVDEQSHHPVRSFASLHASKQNGTKDHILPPRHSRQNLGPGQMAKAGRTYSHLASTFPDTSGEICIESDPGFPNPSPVTPHVKQTERRCGLVHISQHLPEKSLMLLLANS